MFGFWAVGRTAVVNTFSPLKGAGCEFDTNELITLLSHSCVSKPESGSKNDFSSFLQFESVEHLEADVSDVIFIFTVSGHFLQDSSDGIVHLLPIIKIRSATVQNT